MKNKYCKLAFFFMMSGLVACSTEEAQKNEPTGTPAFEHKEEVSREIIPGEMYHDITYYENGQVKMEGNMIDGKKEGKWMSFYEDGYPWSETYFEDGVQQGPTTVWYPNGIKYYEGFYKNGERSGKWKFYNEDGTLDREDEF